MRKLSTTLLLAVALAVVCLPASPVLGQLTQDVTITHLGNPAEFLALARSFVKQRLAVLNTRTEVSRSLAGRPPYTITDVETASAARIREGVAIIVRDFFEVTAQAYDESAASREAVTPVRERDAQTEVDGSFEEPPP